MTANRDKIACKHGHLFDEENTRVKVKDDGSTERRCRACERTGSSARWQLRKRMSRRLTDEDRREIGILRLSALHGEPDALTVVQIAARFQVSTKTVAACLRELLPTLPEDMRIEPRQGGEGVPAAVFRKLYALGLSDERIAQRTGLTVKAAQDRRRALGLLRSDPDVARRRREAIVRLAREGACLREIARAAGVSPNRVWQVAKESGLKVRRSPRTTAHPWRQSA